MPVLNTVSGSHYGDFVPLITHLTTIQVDSAKLSLVTAYTDYGSVDGPESGLRTSLLQKKP